MPFSLGVFSRVYNWATEQLSPPIEISKLDTQEADFATGLSNCLLRDGTGLPTAAIPWNAQNLTGVGNLTAATATFSGALTAASFVPTSTATNGLGLSAANTPGLYSNSTLRWSVNATGNHVIAAPSSGTALAVTGISGTAAITGGLITIGEAVGLVGTGANLYSSSTNALNVGTAGAAALNLYSNSVARVNIASAGNVTINAPSSGTALTVDGNVAIASGASTAARFSRTTTLGGDAIFGTESSVGGTTVTGSSAYAGIFGSFANRSAQVIANGAVVATWTPGGGQQIGAPTGGDKGAGTLNTAGTIYQNNVLVSTVVNSTFTATCTGMTGTTTGTMFYTIDGRIVYMTGPAIGISGTSNTTGMTITGMPVACRPTTNKLVTTGGYFLDNGLDYVGMASVSSAGVIDCSLLTVTGSKITGGAFTGSGTKGIDAGWTLCYSLD